MIRVAYAIKLIITAEKAGKPVLMGMLLRDLKARGKVVSDEYF